MWIKHCLLDYIMKRGKIIKNSNRVEGWVVSLKQNTPLRMKFLAATTEATTKREKSMWGFFLGMIWISRWGSGGKACGFWLWFHQLWGAMVRERKGEEENTEKKKKNRWRKEALGVTVRLRVCEREEVPRSRSSLHARIFFL